MSANHGASQNDRHQTGDIYPNGNIVGYGNVSFSGNDTISEPYQAQVLEDNSNRECWDDHSNYVNSIFGLPDPESIDPRWLVGPPIPMFAGQAFAFNEQGNHPDDAFNHAVPQVPNCAHGPAEVVVGNYASSVSLPRSIPQTSPPMASPSLPPEMALSSTPLHGYSTTPTEDKTDAVNLMLLDLRHAGKTYPEISRAIERDLGVVIQPNALTKRYSKMEDVRMSLLPVAIRNSMPEIMSVIKRSLARMNDGTHPEMEMQRAHALLQTLPNSLPRYVESRLARSGRTNQSPASTQGFP